MALPGQTADFVLPKPIEHDRRTHQPQERQTDPDHVAAHHHRGLAHLLAIPFTADIHCGSADPFEVMVRRW
jgi:hypothetical protein